MDQEEPPQQGERQPVLALASINTRAGSMFGAGNLRGFFGGGHGQARAWRTVRRCTRYRVESSRIDNPSRR